MSPHVNATLAELERMPTSMLFQAEVMDRVGARLEKRERLKRAVRENARGHHARR